MGIVSHLSEILFIYFLKKTLFCSLRHLALDFVWIIHRGSLSFLLELVLRCLGVRDHPFPFNNETRCALLALWQWCASLEFSSGRLLAMVLEDPECQYPKAVYFWPISFSGRNVLPFLSTPDRSLAGKIRKIKKMWWDMVKDQCVNRPSLKSVFEWYA